MFGKKSRDIYKFGNVVGYHFWPTT